LLQPIGHAISLFKLQRLSRVSRRLSIAFGDVLR
jgi:hypothetical protein